LIAEPAHVPARGQSIGETGDEENHQGSNPVRSPHIVHSPRRVAASFNQITGANSRCAGQSDGCWSHNAVVAGASAMPAAVAQFWRWPLNTL